MKQALAHVTLLVEDYDRAIAYYTDVLDFELLDDRVLSETKRWVLVRPRGGSGTALLLAEASNVEQRARVGDQTGGRVAFFLQTDDFERDFQKMKSAGVHFLEDPRTETYGIVAVFEDLYGNHWDLLELNLPASTSSK